MKREIVQKRLKEDEEKRQDAMIYGSPGWGDQLMDEVREVFNEKRLLQARAKQDQEIAKYLAGSDMTEEDKEYYLKVIAAMDSEYDE
jgi:flavorubredoxin